MILVASYLLKVVICSGILLLYYYIALRNKLFHQWNRFYLLAAVVLSLVIPAVQITISQLSSNEPIQILHAVQSANVYLDEIIITRKPTLSPLQFILPGYILISSLLLFSLIFSITRIISIIRSHTINVIRNIKFVNTKVPGTPFSFFDYIFWNKHIDLQSETGQQIFQHELVHVKEKHTIDKLFIQLVLIVSWCNPFFWLIRKELKLIHEFIADKKAVAEHGTAAFATMILQAQYPQGFNPITNQFFQTSIKRRLAMLTKIQNPKINYISRIIALPIMALVFLAFTLRTKKATPIIPLEKTITVVIDAGHGKMPNGNYNGARSGDVYEDEITLALAKAIVEENTNDKINLILTRSSDNIVDLKERVAIAQRSHADLFISLHVDVQQKNGTTTEDNSASGIGVYISNKNTAYQQQSEILGSAVRQELNSIYPTSPGLVKTGAWVLDQNICPSVLIEVGYLSNSKDREFITKESNQKLIAQRILTAIEMYASQKQNQPIIADTTQTSKSNVTKKILSNISSEIKPKDTAKPTIFVDGTQVDKFEKVSISNIDTMNILKGKAATDKYGEQGKNGVIEIISKSKVDTVEFDATIQPQQSNTPKIRDVTLDVRRASDTVPKNQPIFEKMDVEASVDKAEWRKHLEKNLQSYIEQAAQKGMAPGQYTVNVRFIVGKDGSISDVTALNDPGYGLAAAAIKVVRTGPKWSPAMQNGKVVRSYHDHPITFVISEQ